MRNWNVVVTVREPRFAQAWHLLAPYGVLHKTEFYNVLTLQVSDTAAFLQDLHRQLRQQPELGESVARVVPVSTRFEFQSPAAFEEQAKAALVPWVERLAGQRFHVRMHRRGFKGRLSSQTEERFLDGFLLQCLAERGATAMVDFDDPDMIIAVETVGQQAGLSLWSREALARYPLVKLD